MDDSIFFQRQSKRSYTDKPIEEDVMNRLLEKIRWSPSCANKQPWRFVFVSDPAQKLRLAGALAKGNQWALKAPVLIAVCARESDDYTREDDPVVYYQFDCGLGTMGLLLAATHEGLMAHTLAGYDAPKVHEVLNIPDEYHVMCMISLGYQGGMNLLDEDTRKKDESPRTRKELNEIISFDRFEF